MHFIQRSLGRIYLGLSLRQVCILSICSILLFGPVAKGVRDSGPAYLSDGRVCQDPRECEVDRGEVCWWFYDGCAKGTCVCDPRRYTTSPEGACLPIREGNDSCNIDLVCPLGMSCQKGSCQCDLGQMTSDKKFCKQAYHKFLGEECAPYDNACVQKDSKGYTDTNVACSFSIGECTCNDDYIQDGLACRRRNIGEDGCTANYHCQGGAVCSRGKCACPIGYKAVAYSTKCAPSRAVSNLRIGQSCDEINESKYCGYGLVCHVCGGEQVGKCVRYESYEARSSGGGSGKQVNSSSQTSTNSVYIMSQAIAIFFINWYPLR